MATLEAARPPSNSSIPSTPAQQQLRTAQDLFIRRWGEMGQTWGINRTMAEIHALLYIVGQPLCTDDVMERLNISRGNASMSLRALCDWGIIRRLHKRGERREYFESLSDVWEMFSIIAAERKRDRITERRHARLQGAAGVGDRTAGSSVALAASPLEGQVVAMMLQYPGMLPEIETSKVLDYFTDDTLSFLGRLILKHPPAKEEGISNLMSMVDDDEKRNILASLSMKEEMWNRRDCRKIITKLIAHSPKRLELSLKEQIRAAEKEDNPDLVIELLEKLHRKTVSSRNRMKAILREQ